jgi:hypothetical protein
MKRRVLKAIGLMLMICILLVSISIPSFASSQTPVFYMPFDGDTNDYSGNNNNGTVIGTPPLTYSSGVFYGALSIGNTGYNSDGGILVDNPGFFDFLNTSTISISTYLKLDANSSGGYIVHKPGAYDLYITADGRVILILRGSSYSSQTSISKNLWHFLAVTITLNSANGVQMYLDGNLILSNANTVGITSFATPTSGNVNKLCIGAKYLTDTMFQMKFGGFLDELKIYDRALTAAERVTTTTLELAKYFNNNLSDSSSNSNPASFVGTGTTYTAHGYYGGPGLLFNGNGGVSINNQHWLEMAYNNFTIYLAFKYDPAKTQTGTKTLLDKRDLNNIGYHVAMYEGRPLIQLHDSEGHWANFYPTGGSTYYDNNTNYIHTLKITVDRASTTGIKMYVDSILIYTGNPTAITGSLFNTANLLVGKHKDSPGTNFTGLIDDLFIYTGIY